MSQIKIIIQEKIYIFILISIFIYFKIKKYFINRNKHEISDYKIFEVNFEYHKYERQMITEKIHRYSNWELVNEEPYFINGIIRKYKPKKCLEIGVAYGGSSIVILNAIKDIKDSFLVSLDLNNNVYTGEKVKTGYNANKYFPELTNKWKLFTGEQPNKFLDALNLKFSFLYLDTTHATPGELINIIEALPFLEDNAIIILHGIMSHSPSYRPLNKNYKYFPSQIYLMTSLIGDKIVIDNKENGCSNIGAVFLFPNQERYYLNYFLLLASNWEYMPSENQIKDLRLFIRKYYKKDIFLNIFNTAVNNNKYLFL